MEQKRILVVDDERDLCDILLFNLSAAGYQADAACSAEDALQRGIADYDLLLLDVMMPGMSGFELAKRLKEDEDTRHIPVIFLTAKDTEDDTLHGFSLGADDYVTKPFSVREVMARVKAVLNRSLTQSRQEEGSLVYEGLVVNTINKTVKVDGNGIPLTRTEYELLKLLLEHRGHVFSRQQLLDKVWPHDVIVTERTVDVNIARLRKKLTRYAVCLVSRTGFGYCFEDVINKG
jgi:DNA-binding response OmpR family regulator